MKLPITIEYNSGESATYIAQPPEWAKWEKQTGHTLSKAQEVIGIWDLMFLAYNAHKRESAGKPVKPFEIWMETVADVSTGLSEPKSHKPGSIRRTLVELAIQTGIPMQYWDDADDIATAAEILEGK
jgi:hypothetical protein